MSKYTDIKAELDGNAGLYGAMSDQQVTDELNAVDKPRNRTSMSRQEIYENIVGADLAALTAIELAQINLAMSDSVDPFGNAAQVFNNIFTGTTITNLTAARVETVSRATILGIGNVHVGFVTTARAL